MLVYLKLVKRTLRTVIYTAYCAQILHVPKRNTIEDIKVPLCMCPFESLRFVVVFFFWAVLLLLLLMLLLLLLINAL